MPTILVLCTFSAVCVPRTCLSRQIPGLFLGWVRQWRAFSRLVRNSPHLNPPCLSSVSFASSPLHLLALSPCVHPSLQPVPASLLLLLAPQPPVLASPYLRAASAKVPVRVDLAHRHTTFFFFFSDKAAPVRSQPTVSCRQRLQRSWHTRRKVRSKANQSLSRSSRPLVFGQYVLPSLFLFFRVKEVWFIETLSWIRSKTFLAMTRSRSIASLETRSTSRIFFFKLSTSFFNLFGFGVLVFLILVFL